MINCIAVDDETLALDLIEDNIRQVPFLHLVKRCKNAYEALEVMQQQKIDLIFLDIQMPGITGVQFLQGLVTRPLVIFITAYKQYALEGFELDVLDYLLKPVSFDRFLKAAHKANEQVKLKAAALTTVQPASVYNDYFFVNAEYNLVKINLSDISHIEGLKDYIKIHLLSRPKPVITRLSIKAMEEKLPPAAFVRVHKSYMIAVDKINFIRKNRIHLLNNAEVPLSEHYRSGLFNSINPGTASPGLPEAG